jgi:hypothetical protein
VPVLMSLPAYADAAAAANAARLSDQPVQGGRQKERHRRWGDHGELSAGRQKLAAIFPSLGSGPV